MAFAVAAAVALAIYYLSADAAVRRPDARDPVSLTMWGMGVAALGWAIVAPWWTFPWDSLAGVLYPLGAAGPAIPAAALAGWMVLMGTVVPFSLVVISMQHLRASQASVVGMTEPIFAIVLVSVLAVERNR